MNVSLTFRSTIRWLSHKIKGVLLRIFDKLEVLLFLFKSSLTRLLIVESLAISKNRRSLKRRLMICNLHDSVMWCNKVMRPLNRATHLFRRDRGQVQLSGWKVSTERLELSFISEEILEPLQKVTGDIYITIHHYTTTTCFEALRLLWHVIFWHVKELNWFTSEIEETSCGVEHF